MRLRGEEDMKQISDAWLINERTSGDWLRFGFQIGKQVRLGTLSDATLAAMASKAGNSATEIAINGLLLQAVRNFMQRNPQATGDGRPVDL